MSTRATRHLFSFLSLSVLVLASACSGGGSGGGSAALGAFDSSGRVVALDPSTMRTRVEAGPSGYASVAGFARDSARDVIYAVDSDDGTLLSIDRHGRVERLRSLSAPPGRMAWDAATETLVGLRGNAGFLPSDLVRVDPTTGDAEVVASVPGRVFAVALDAAAGRLLAVDATSGGMPSNRLVAIDLQTGAKTTLFENPNLHSIRGLTLDPVTRLLYGVDELGGLYAFDLFQELIVEAWFFDRPFADVDIDTDSGRFFALGSGGAVFELLRAATQHGDLDVLVTLGRELHGLAFDPAGHRYFAVDLRNGELVEVDPRDGHAEAIATLSRNPSDLPRDVRTLAYDPMLNRMFAVDRSIGQVIEVDPATGVCSEIGLSAGVEMRLALDPASGRLYGYDEAVEVLVEIDVQAPAKHVLANAIGLTKVDALAFDPLTERIVAIHETPGHAGETTLSSISLSVSGGAGLLAHSRAPEGITALGRDPETGLFHAAGSRQPWFELELDLTSGSSQRQRITSLDGAWQTVYRAALSVPARGVVYAIDRELLYEYDPRQRSMRLLGAQPAGTRATDLVYDPGTGEIGLRDGDSIRWVSRSAPWLIRRSSAMPLVPFASLRLTCDPSTGRILGVAEGLLFDVVVGPSASLTTRTAVPRADFVADSIAYSAERGAVFAVGEEAATTPFAVRFDVATGEWADAGPVQEVVRALFTP